MKYSKGFSATFVLIAIGILVIMTGVGLLVQKRSVMSPPTVSQTTIQIKPADATDMKLDKDFSDIDASMNTINADATTIDAGLNDQMGDLSE